MAQKPSRMTGIRWRPSCDHIGSHWERSLFAQLCTDVLADGQQPTVGWPIVSDTYWQSGLEKRLKTMILEYLGISWDFLWRFSSTICQDMVGVPDVPVAKSQGRSSTWQDRRPVH